MKKETIVKTSIASITLMDIPINGIFVYKGIPYIKINYNTDSSKFYCIDLESYTGSYFLIKTEVFLCKSIKVEVTI